MPACVAPAARRGGPVRPWVTIVRMAMPSWLLLPGRAFDVAAAPVPALAGKVVEQTVDLAVPDGAPAGAN